MIHLRTFNLEKIDVIKHGHLIRNLSDNQGVYKYISKNFIEWIKKQKSEDDLKLEVGKSYVVVRDNKYIGMIGSLNLTNDGILELWCAIDDEFRNKGYADKLLGEITLYSLENINGIRDICLVINRSNIASQKVAAKNGYIQEEVFNDFYKYYYFGKKSR